MDDKYTIQDTLKVEFPGGEEIITALLKRHSNIKLILFVKRAASREDIFAKFENSFSDIFTGNEIKIAVLYQNPTVTSLIDFVGKEGPEPWPEKFPWHKCDLYQPYLRDIFTSPK